MWFLCILGLFDYAKKIPVKLLVVPLPFFKLTLKGYYLMSGNNQKEIQHHSPSIVGEFVEIYVYIALQVSPKFNLVTDIQITLFNVTHSNSNFECNKERGSIDQLYIELGLKVYFLQLNILPILPIKTPNEVRNPKLGHTNWADKFCEICGIFGRTTYIKVSNVWFMSFRQSIE